MTTQALAGQVVAIFHLWEKTQHFPKVMNFSYLIPDFYYITVISNILGHFVAPGYCFFPFGGQQVPCQAGR